MWPDNDDAGERYAVAVLGILQTLGCRISGLDVDRLNLPPKGDAVEWLQTRPNASLGDLQELPLLAYQSASQNPIAGDLATVELHRGDAITEAVTWYWPDWIAA